MHGLIIVTKFKTIYRNFTLRRFKLFELIVLIFTKSLNFLVPEKLESKP